jgi:hypothetical protein
MKISNLMKGALVASAVMISANSFAQIQDEKNVTVTMELVPILQLNMNTPDQVNFVFDEISEYLGGITKYGATILTASSTVSWDLFASGTSGRHGTAATNRTWDPQVRYGTAAVTNAAGGAYDSIPLTALELSQFPGQISSYANAAVFAAGSDYSPAFAPLSALVGGRNNIYVSAGSPYVAPPAFSATANNKYIAGGATTDKFVPGGSYLTASAVAANQATSAYYFVIDYRIVPGLPAIFPAAANGSTAESIAGAGGYAKPGVYTMNVKYLMIENQ